MEYAEAKFKQLAVEYALTLYKNGAISAQSLVGEAKIIEAYLKEDNGQSD